MDDEKPEKLELVFSDNLNNALQDHLEKMKKTNARYAEIERYAVNTTYVIAGFALAGLGILVLGYIFM